MSTVLLILPAVAFAAWYLAVMVICGAITSRADKRSRTGDAVDDSRRGVAMFLIGSAFAPCLIGVAAAGVWTILPGMDWWFYPALHVMLAVLVLLGLRKPIASVRADFKAYLSGGANRRWAMIFLLAVFVGVGFFAVHQSTQPIAGYDACTYALDARRVVEARDGAALMGFGADPANNHLANHNHGSSYQYFLSGALMFSPEAVQDFAMRLAVQILALHVFLAVLGLGLLVSGPAALVALSALLSYKAFGWQMVAFSRDFYRVLPVLILVGLLAPRQGQAGGGSLTRFDMRWVLAVAAFGFLWNAHAIALLVAPLVLICVLAACRSWRSAGLTVAAFLASVPLGGWRLIRAAVDTGSPMGYSPFFNANYEGTAVVESWWAARGAQPVGWSHAGTKLATQFTEDGGVLVALLWAALAGAVVWAVIRLLRRRGDAPVSPVVLVIWLMVAVTELLLAGLLDPITGRPSTTLAMNYRYRAQMYLVGAVLIGAMADGILTRLPKRLHRRCLVGLCGLLVLAAIAMVLSQMRSHGMLERPYIDARQGRRHLAGAPATRWMRQFAEAPDGSVILMDYAYLGWYHTDARIIFTQDPRVREAFAAATPAEAADALDELGITHVFLIDLERQAIMDSNLPLGVALRSPEYKRIGRRPGFWTLYRRADTPAAATAPAEK